MNIDLTDLITAILTLIFALIARYVIPWIKANINEKTLKDIVYWADVAVDWAEQKYKGMHGKGETKKAEVIEFLDSYLLSKGYTINYDELDHLVEALVKRMNSEKTLE